MSNLVITTTAKTFEIDFGSKAKKHQTDKASYLRDDIEEVIKRYNSDHIEVSMLNGRTFILSYNGHASASTVDSIDGSSPTDNNDLYTKLKTIQG